MHSMTSADTASLRSALAMYLGGFAIGLTLVSFPASSAVLKAKFGLSDAQYGAIYIPQLVAAILGAVSGGYVAGKITLKAQFLWALVCFLAAQICLASSIYVQPDFALGIVMCATALFGFGFGFGGGPLNAVVALLFPNKSTTAITALHMSAGAGLTLGPYVFAVLAGEARWVQAPLGLALYCAALLVLTLSARFPEPPKERPASDSFNTPTRSAFFWLCALIGVVYSIAEGTFSNWAILFLSEERGVETSSAALALTAFWAALTFGRFVSSIIAIHLQPATFLYVFPWLIAAALWILPSVNSALSGIWKFALAGLACSAFFPMLVAYTAGRYPNHVARVSSSLTAALMVGVGIGSYGVGALASTYSVSELYGFALVCPLAIVFLLMASRRV